MGQTFCLTVPASSCSVTAGAGPVDGFSFTTEGNAFHHAVVNSIHEACADLRLVSGAVLGAAASSGVLIGTPCTIQITAGGGVQIYAGAGITPSLGGPSGPGEAFGPSSPAEFEAGNRAESMNRINDGIKGLSDVAGAVMDFRDAEGRFQQAKAVFEGLKGGWDTAKALGAESGATDTTADSIDAGFGLASGIINADPTAIISAVVKGGTIGAKLAAPANSGAGIGNTTAPTGPTCVDGAAGGAMGAPGDGPRIHEVAPASIDRKCGANMTAAVGGKKESKVDGNIEYMSGGKIEMKAFSKVETQSLFFEAHANVTAAMKGLAQAKVESFGKTTIEGKASVTVSSAVKGKFEAPKINIAAKATLDISSPKITVGAGTLTIDSMTTIQKHVVMKKNVRIGMKLQVGEGAEIKRKLDVDGPIKATGKIYARQKLENPYFKAG